MVGAVSVSGKQLRVYVLTHFDDPSIFAEKGLASGSDLFPITDAHPQAALCALPRLELTFFQSRKPFHETISCSARSGKAQNLHFVHKTCPFCGRNDQKPHFVHIIPPFCGRRIRKDRHHLLRHDAPIPMARHRRQIQTHIRTP